MQVTYTKRGSKLGQDPCFDITMLSDFNPPDKRLRNGCEREHYEIMWIWEGTGNYKVNHSNYPITPNSLYCGAPGQYHQLVTNEAVKGLIISFNYDFIHHGDDSDGVTCAPVLNEFFQFAIVRLEEGVAGELNMLIEKMQFELKNGQQMKTEILKFYLRILLIHIKRTMNISEEGIAGVNSMVRKFFTQVETDFVKKKSVSEYASMLCITANYLNQIVKQQTGDTAGFYIRRRIIAEAKRKALHSDQSMKQIAFSLGFDSEAHFSKFFKNYTGTNFSEFKRNCFSQASSSLQSYQRHLKQPA